MAFVEFLGRWRSEIGRVRERDVEGTVKAYLLRVHEFNGHATKVTRDIFWKRDRFIHLRKEMASLDAQITNKKGDCREVVAKRIDRFIALAEKAFGLF